MELYLSPGTRAPPPHDWGREALVNVFLPPICPYIVREGTEVEIHHLYQLQNAKEGTGIGLGDVVDNAQYR